MRRAIHFLARLYPTSWRERYGAEFEVLLDDVNPNWRTLLDVLKGAMMQMTAWNSAKIAISFGVLGALLAGATSFAIPSRYASVAVLRMVAADRAAASRRMSELAQIAMSRHSLMNVIVKERLYVGERARMPIEDVVQRVHDDIRIEPMNNLNGSALFVQFVYPDAAVAQRTTQELIASLIDENLRVSASRIQGATLELLDPATLPKKPVSPKRAVITGLGLASGLLLGTIVALYRRQRPHPVAP